MVPRLQRGLAPKGFTLLIPLTLFALTQKSKQKKSRLRPSHSKNLRAKSWNRQNSLRRKTSKLKQRRFLTAFHPCFSAHRSRSVLPTFYRCKQVRGEHQRVKCVYPQGGGAYAIRPYNAQIIYCIQKTPACNVSTVTALQWLNTNPLIIKN